MTDAGIGFLCIIGGTGEKNEKIKKIDETFEGIFTFKHAGLSPVEIQKKVL